MHMADSLVSPVVGGAMWAVSSGLILYSSKKIAKDENDSIVPLMGVLGAFVFAAQMINFTIPGTGSSGHIGGGMLLAILLGPYAGFLVISSVLVIQALFFADGGLLALGCNMFNLGFFPCFIAYPFIYKKLVNDKLAFKRIFPVTVLASVVGLQLGAVSVVLETTASGISDLPFKPFISLMLPIHLAIGIIEGLITAVLVSAVWKTQPGLLEHAKEFDGFKPLQKVVIGLCCFTLLVGGVLSWFASENPDGLEWAIFKTSGTEEVGSAEHGIKHDLAGLQERTAFLPDYGFKNAPENGNTWKTVRAGTSFSGIIGAIVTLALIFLAGFVLKMANKRRKAVS